MDGSRATCLAPHLKPLLVIVMVVNQQNMIHLPPRKINHDIEVPPHSDLIIPPPWTRIVQTPQLGLLDPSLAEQPKIFHSFSILDANLGAQGMNELINCIYYIVQRRNSKANEERFIRLEESIYHAQPRANSTQEAISKKGHSIQSEPFVAKGSKVHKLKDRLKGGKTQFSTPESWRRLRQSCSIPRLKRISSGQGAS